MILFERVYVVDRDVRQQLRIVGEEELGPSKGKETSVRLLIYQFYFAVCLEDMSIHTSVIQDFLPHLIEHAYIAGIEQIGVHFGAQ